MVALLEMVGAIALTGLLLYRAVSALRAWIGTKIIYTRIPNRLYRRTLQHALASRRLMLRLGLAVFAIVAALLTNASLPVAGLLCLLLITELLWSAIPPVVLVSSASETEAAATILRDVTAAARPMKTVHFLHQRTAGAERLRTVDRQYWEEAYGSFADSVPLIVIDCSTVTDHLVNEAMYVLNPLRRWKVMFVCGVSGECPLLGCIGLDHPSDPTVTVVQQLELRTVVRDRFAVGRSPQPPSAGRRRRVVDPQPLRRCDLSVEQCEACSRAMRVLVLAGVGRVMIARDEVAMGISCAEQCWECGRLYCDRCYPARERNTCVCGRGRDTIRDFDGTVYRGSLRLVKVEYMV